ncbi:MAG: hypothetical protein ABIS03_02065 [Gemmatimonadaceae bacterium]
MKSITLTSLAIALTTSVAVAQQRPAIRQIGPVTATTTETFANVSGVRALANGALLVNDLSGRRVLLFNPQLSGFTVVADSTAATGNAFSGNFGALVAYRGDSSVFIDPGSVSMLVIDPSGKVGRVIAIPRAEDANNIGSPAGNAGFDAAGNLVYRANPQFRFTGGGPGARTPGAPPALPDPPDSASVVRVNLASRKVDTVGVIRTPKIKLEMKQDDRGNMSITSQINPLPVVDDWVLTSDGSVAFVRGRDYHVDWVKPDGTRASAAKIPFEWQRMSDEDKVAFIDSVKAARERLGANAPIPSAAAGARQQAAAGGGEGPRVQIFTGPGGGGAPNRGGAGAAGGPQVQLNFIPASELPDYKPPFFAGSARADREGNVWIRTIPTSAVTGGAVYDVIDHRGTLVERVQVPEGRTIVGFGPDKSVYLVHRDGAKATIEKASTR